MNIPFHPRDKQAKQDNTPPSNKVFNDWLKCLVYWKEGKNNVIILTRSRLNEK